MVGLHAGRNKRYPDPSHGGICGRHISRAPASASASGTQRQQLPGLCIHSGHASIAGFLVSLQVLRMCMRWNLVSVTMASMIHAHEGCHFISNLLDIAALLSNDNVLLGDAAAAELSLCATFRPAGLQLHCLGASHSHTNWTLQGISQR